MKNIKKQWFTLVELIVVITILAILWSIAFISLQGYSSDARNSKRNSDLGSIQSALSTQLAQWQSILSFVTKVTDNVIVNASWTIAWTWVLADNDYTAWTVNYASLPVKAEDFKDPTWPAYAIWVTKLVNGRYELAASVEQGAWSKVAKVVWNYTPRKWTNQAVQTTWISVNTWTTWTSSSYYSYTLSGSSYVNVLTPWDTIHLVNAAWAVQATWTISRISVDGTIITIWTWVLWFANVQWIKLVKSEMDWLISDNEWTDASVNNLTTIVTEWGTYLPY